MEGAEPGEGMQRTSSMAKLFTPCHGRSSWQAFMVGIHGRPSQLHDKNIAHTLTITSLFLLPSVPVDLYVHVYGVHY